MANFSLENVLKILEILKKIKKIFKNSRKQIVPLL